MLHHPLVSSRGHGQPSTGNGGQRLREQDRAGGELSTHTGCRGPVAVRGQEAELTLRAAPGDIGDMDLRRQEAVPGIPCRVLAAFDTPMEYGEGCLAVQSGDIVYRRCEEEDGWSSVGRNSPYAEGWVPTAYLAPLLQSNPAPHTRALPPPPPPPPTPSSKPQASAATCARVPPPPPPPSWKPPPKPGAPPPPPLPARRATRVCQPQPPPAPHGTSSMQRQEIR